MMKTTIIILISILGLAISGCVQKTHLKTIHFKLDMRNAENPSDVGIRGEFGSDPWNETIYFTDENADSIYEGSITKQSGQYGISFKFVNHHNQFELDKQDNRSVIFEYKPETILYEAKFNEPEAKKVILDMEKK